VEVEWRWSEGGVELEWRGSGGGVMNKIIMEFEWSYGKCLWR
jgi:hypothetical protein